MTATQQLKKEHQAVRLALIFLEMLRIQIENKKTIDVEKFEKLLEFFKIFVDKCHHGKEENFLFPELEKAGIPREDGPIGVMLTEHEFGRDYIRIIEENIQSYKTKPDENNIKKISEAIKGYVELLEQHIYKENNVLFAMADIHLPEKLQEELFEKFEEFELKEIGPGKHDEFHRMLDGMRDNLLGKVKILDVREIPPVQRHGIILNEFDKLNINESFFLVNDHDPKPLYYQFQAEKEGKFNWEYMISGPIIWGVKITKASN